MGLLHALGTEALEPLHLGLQVVSVNVHVDARTGVAEALHQQREVRPKCVTAQPYSGACAGQPCRSRSLVRPGSLAAGVPGAGMSPIWRPGPRASKYSLTRDSRSPRSSQTDTPLSSTGWLVAT